MPRPHPVAVSQSIDKQVSSKGKGQCEARIKPITINESPIGKACSPYEVIQVQAEGGIFPVAIIYDTGSEVLLCNYETGPLVVDTKR